MPGAIPVPAKIVGNGPIASHVARLIHVSSCVQHPKPDTVVRPLGMVRFDHGTALGISLLRYSSKITETHFSTAYRNNLLSSSSVQIMCKEPGLSSGVTPRVTQSELDITYKKRFKNTVRGCGDAMLESISLR